jgi:dCMP deaminase
MRPTKDEVFLKMADILSTRATCSRRAVGCILVNESGHIIGSGYNGNGAGLSHCLDTPCLGVSFDSGSGLDVCEAIHAEQNALMQCSNVKDIHTAYVTSSPCMHCAKLFLNTGVKLIVTTQVYDEKAIRLLNDAGIELRIEKINVY